MTALELPHYQIAGDRIKGNPVIATMGAGVVAVPLAELAHEDGTPRFAFMQQANRAFGQAQAQNADNPCYQPYPADPARHLGLIAEAVLAERAAIREVVASAMAPPGTDPESGDVTAIIERLRAGESPPWRSPARQEPSGDLRSRTQGEALRKERCREGDGDGDGRRRARDYPGCRRHVCYHDRTLRPGRCRRAAACRPRFGTAAVYIAGETGDTARRPDQRWFSGLYSGSRGATSAILLCDGCFQAATGLLAGCEEGCPQDVGHTGLCLGASPGECQWCGSPGRLREVSRADVGHLLPAVGEEDEGLWFLHWADGRRGPYPSAQAAWDDWHANPPPPPMTAQNQGTPA